MGYSSRKIIVSSLLIVSVVMGCSSGAVQTDPDLFLDSAQIEQVLAADQIVSFYITFSQQIAEQIEIEVSLETLDGSDWKAALCYDDQCFMHDGRQKLMHGMLSAQTTEFEIKYFVPPNAGPGDSKAVRMGVWLKGKPRQKATIDLLGYLPEP